MLTNWLNYLVNMKNIKNQNTEEQILQAAKKVFQSKGMEGARMQEIADEAGINKAMLHYYFRSKELLFEAVFFSAFALLAPQLKSVLENETSIEEKVKQFTSNYISFIVEHPYLPNFIILELNRNEDFIIKLKENKSFLNLDAFEIQVQNEVSKGIIKPISSSQLFMNILALNMFPFLAKPILKAITNSDEATFQQLMEARKTEVANFIINAIKTN